MRKSFLLHLDSLCILEELDDVQKGQLFNAIYKYQLGDEIELTPIVKIAFSQFKNQFQRDNEKYKNVCEVRKQAGSIGGKQRVANQANASKSKQDEANQADNKNKNKNKSDNDSVKDKDKEDIKKEFSFSLSKDTHYSNLSEEYKTKLMAKCLLIDGDFKRYEDFILSLESKASYKYKDFTLTYRSWDKEKKYKAYTPEPEPMLGDDWCRVGLGGGKYIAINAKTYEMKSGEASVHEHQNIEPLQQNKKRDMNNLVKGTFNEI